MSDNVETQDITVNLVVMGKGSTLNVPAGTTLADALEEAGVDSDSAIRFRGEALDGSGLDVVLIQGDTVISTPPEVDHGA